MRRHNEGFSNTAAMADYPPQYPAELAASIPIAYAMIGDDRVPIHHPPALPARFRSSPQSTKARLMAERVARDHPAVTWWCPQLPPSPRAAMEHGDAGHRRLAARSHGGDRLLAGRLLRHLAGRATAVQGGAAQSGGAPGARPGPARGRAYRLARPGTSACLRARVSCDELRALQCAGPAQPDSDYLLSSPRATRCWTGAR